MAFRLSSICTCLRRWITYDNVIIEEDKRLHCTIFLPEKAAVCHQDTRWWCQLRNTWLCRHSESWLYFSGVCSHQNSRWEEGAVLRNSQLSYLQVGAEAGSKVPAAAQKRGISSLTVFAVNCSWKCWCDNCVSDGMSTKSDPKKQSSSEECWLLESVGCRRHNSPFLPSVWSRGTSKYYLTRWKCPGWVVLWSSPAIHLKRTKCDHKAMIISSYVITVV